MWKGTLTSVIIALTKLGRVQIESTPSTDDVYADKRNVSA